MAVSSEIHTKHINTVYCYKVEPIKVSSNLQKATVSLSCHVMSVFSTDFCHFLTLVLSFSVLFTVEPNKSRSTRSPPQQAVRDHGGAFDSSR
jgi:hypothetical protein